MEKHGEKIKNSNLYRDFCHVCKTPIRIVKAELNQPHLCEMCDTKRHIGCSSPKETFSRVDEETYYLERKDLFNKRND